MEFLMNIFRIETEDLFNKTSLSVKILRIFSLILQSRNIQTHKINTLLNSDHKNLEYQTWHVLHKSPKSYNWSKTIYSICYKCWHQYNGPSKYQITIIARTVNTKVMVFRQTSLNIIWNNWERHMCKYAIVVYPNVIKRSKKIYKWHDSYYFSCFKNAKGNICIKTVNKISHIQHPHFCTLPPKLQATAPKWTRL